MARYRTKDEAKADLFDYIGLFYAPQEVPLGTTGNESTPRSAKPCPERFWSAGSALSMRKNWRPNADRLEDEKQREPQDETSEKPLERLRLHTPVKKAANSHRLYR